MGTAWVNGRVGGLFFEKIHEFLSRDIHIAEDGPKRPSRNIFSRVPRDGRPPAVRMLEHQMRCSALRMFKKSKLMQYMDKLPVFDYRQFGHFCYTGAVAFFCYVVAVVLRCDYSRRTGGNTVSYIATVDSCVWI